MSTGLPYMVNIKKPIPDQKNVERYRKTLESMNLWCSEVIVDHWGWNYEQNAFCFSYEKDKTLFILKWASNLE